MERWDDGYCSCRPHSGELTTLLSDDGRRVGAAGEMARGSLLGWKSPGKGNGSILGKVPKVFYLFEGSMEYAGKCIPYSRHSHLGLLVSALRLPFPVSLCPSPFSLFPVATSSQASVLKTSILVINYIAD